MQLVLRPFSFVEVPIWKVEMPLTIPHIVFKLSFVNRTIYKLALALSILKTLSIKISKVVGIFIIEVYLLILFTFFHLQLIWY